MMPDQPNIPWTTWTTTAGEVPLYIVQYDKDGGCTSPQSEQALVDAAKRATDVLVISHGWNNDWVAATQRYQAFLNHVFAMRDEHWPHPERPLRLVVAGVTWPSTALVAPWERGPDIAGADPVADEVAALKAELTQEQQSRLDVLLAAPRPGAQEERELAEMLAPTLEAGDGDTEGPETAISADDLLAVWEAARATPTETEPGGFIDDEAAEDPLTAGFNPFDLLRKGIRLTTVLQMKDRGGRVGGRGVATTLRRLTDETSARIALVGHSYGAKVVLSALCNGPAPSRSVDSVLLLQPALSCYAFTDDLEGIRGGYRDALDRVRLPIVTTWSEHDSALRRFFHLAVRRRSDLAEAQIAGRPPSKFSALGGYGPYAVPGGHEQLPMPGAGQDYPLTGARRVVAVDATDVIGGHGEVQNDATGWALVAQLKG